ncbi:FxsB family cyclophane-forming radical SAM/SPASM peptide maturase [Streptomyces albidoflavus]
MPRSVGPSRPPADAGPPYPFRQFIVKVHGRCNLACRYCYLYEGPDTGWRDRPAAASDAVLALTADRIAEHAAAHRLPAVSLVLHGGEPLLAGTERLAAFAGLVRRRVPGHTRVRVTLQTNATLLTAARVRDLARARIAVGVSLDGGRARHNTARVDHAGRPSWPAALRGTRLLAEHAPEAYAGILLVVDPAQDPAEVYRSLLRLRPPAVGLLLPHGNWSAPPPGLHPPPGPPARAGAGAPAPYGDWLAAVFDLWWGAGRRQTRVRLFEDAVAALLGLPAGSESLGLDPFTAVVVETDGSLEQVDSLKSAYPGAAATGLTLGRNSFDDALTHPGIAARQSGPAALAADCRACPLLHACGGGHYAHRHRAGAGFGHPTVYCADQQRFLHHVAAALARATGTGPARDPTTAGEGGTR